MAPYRRPRKKYTRVKKQMPRNARGQFVTKKNRGRAGAVDVAAAIAPYLLAPGMKGLSYLYDQGKKYVYGGNANTTKRKFGSTSVKNVRYNTTGYAGKFQGKYQTAKPSAYVRYGVVRKQESGGTITADKCAYVGHSTAIYAEEHLCVWMAMIRSFLKKTGIQVRQVSDTFNMSLDVFWYESSDTINLRRLSQAVIGSLAPITVKQLAINMMNALYGDLKTGGYSDFTIDEIVLTVNSTGAVGGEERMRAAAKALGVNVMKQNVLRLQNKTKAADPSAAVENLATDIENNPLKGLCYESDMGGLIPQDRPFVSTAWTGFVPAGTGLIGVMQGTVDPAIYNKPPQGSFFRHCTRAGHVYLAPGQIKSSTLFDKFNITFHGWISSQRRLVIELGNQLTVNTSDTRTFQYHGKSKLYALEKLLDTRSDDEIAADITIGYQLNTEVGAIVRIQNEQIMVEEVNDENTPKDFLLAVPPPP